MHILVKSYKYIMKKYLSLFLYNQIQKENMNYNANLHFYLFIFLFKLLNEYIK